MVWFFVVIFFVNLLLGFMQASIWAVIVVNLIIMGISMYKSFYPVLFEKDPEKIMEFLKNSKHPHFQFYYYFFNDQLDEAENKLHQIKSPDYKNLNEVNLLIKRKQFDEAKEKAHSVKKYKWYTLAGIAIEQGDRESFKEYKEKVTEPFYRKLLEMEEQVQDGKKEKVISEIENLFPNLRGLKLLSVIQYKKDLLSRHGD